MNAILFLSRQALALLMGETQDQVHAIIICVSVCVLNVKCLCCHYYYYYYYYVSKTAVPC
jgi:hypothetical protein